MKKICKLKPGTLVKTDNSYDKVKKVYDYLKSFTTTYNKLKYCGSGKNDFGLDFESNLVYSTDSFDSKGNVTYISFEEFEKLISQSEVEQYQIY